MKRQLCNYNLNKFLTVTFSRVIEDTIYRESYLKLTCEENLKKNSSEFFPKRKNEVIMKYSLSVNKKKLDVPTLTVKGHHFCEYYISKHTRSSFNIKIITE